MPSDPGNGKTSPFGNGAGGTKGPDAMPVDFTKYPNGEPGAMPARPNYETESELSAQDAAPGDRILKADAVPHPSKDLGAGTIGNPVKPFRLDGGE